jgi:hypothetical protein
MTINSHRRAAGLKPCPPNLGHLTMLWTSLETGQIQRICWCDWQTAEVRDTPENRRILSSRADEHVKEAADARATGG